MRHFKPRGVSFLGCEAALVLNTYDATVTITTTRLLLFSSVIARAVGGVLFPSSEGVTLRLLVVVLRQEGLFLRLFDGRFYIQSRALAGGGSITIARRGGSPVFHFWVDALGDFHQDERDAGNETEHRGVL